VIVFRVAAEVGWLRFEVAMSIFVVRRAALVCSSWSRVSWLVLTVPGGA
jgi:hypothetical protein